MKVSKIREVAAIMIGVLLLGGVLVAEAVEPPPVIWNVTFNGVSNDEARGVAVGPDGHPVVTGVSATDGPAADDIRTIKYNKATGAVIWNVTFDSGGGSDDAGYGVAIGLDGNPVVVGDSDFDIRVIKYSGATGAVLWTVAFDSGTLDFGRGVAVGPDGHPVITGFSCGPLGTDPCIMRTIKYDGATGVVLWTAVFSTVNGSDLGSGVAVGPDGHPVATGNTGVGGEDLIVVKYDGATGTLLWSVALSESDAAFSGVGIGSDNSPVVTGNFGNTGDVRTVKFDGSAGTVLWTAIFDSGGGSGSNDSTHSVTVGPDGNPVIGGSSCTFNPTLGFEVCSILTIKYDGVTGAVLWNFESGRFGRSDRGSGVAVGSSGNPVVTGSSCSSSTFQCDMRTIQFLEFTPAVPPVSLWNVTFDLDPVDEGYASGVAVGLDSHPVVAGVTCNPGCDFQTIKYDSTTGAVLWSVTFDSGNQDQAFGIAVGPDDHPLVTGRSCNADFSLCDARTIKYDGVTGAIIWNVVFDTGGEDSGLSISVGADGNPVVKVSSPRVVKYDGSTGSVLWDVTVGGTEGDVAVGPDGHPVVAGTSGRDIRTTKLDGATGAVLWDVTFDSGETDEGKSVAVGPDGNPVVTGHSDYKFRTIKYDGVTGAIIWTSTLSTGDDEGNSVAIGSDGHPVVTGYSLSGGSYVFRTIKYDKATGTVLWTVVFKGGGDETAGDVAVGPDGNPVVTGNSCDEVYCDFRTIKYLLQYETSPGSNIGVTLNGGSSVADGLSVTYASVTSAGDTTLTTSATGPTPPAGFNLGDPPTYYDIATTATATGPITVCINYTNRPVPSPESDLKLLHFEGGSWVDVTTSLDTVTNVICGSVNSLSPFVIAAPAQRALAATVEIKPEKWNIQWGTKDGHGKVSALIGNIAGHSAREIDPASVRLNGTVPVAEKGRAHKLHAKVKKHRKGFDGPVLEVKFNKFDAFRSLGAVSVGQTVTVRVSGTLRDGTPFEGTDAVLIIGKE